MGRTLSKALESFSAKESSGDVQQGEAGADADVLGEEDGGRTGVEERTGTHTDMLRPRRGYEERETQDIRQNQHKNGHGVMENRGRGTQNGCSMAAARGGGV